MTDDRLERIAALALRKIGETRQSAAAPVAGATRAYGKLHRAAAVLSGFRPEELRRVDPHSSDFDALLSDSAPREDAPASQLWALLPHVRATVLARMANAGQIREAINAARGVVADDPLTHALEVLIAPNGGSLEALDIPSLICLSPVMPALQSVLTDAPSRDDVERRLELLRLLQPFERLVGAHFAGRQTELQQLSDYVGVLPPGSKWEALSRLVSTRKAPLLIWGVGGVGKSTLVAKFILTHAKLPDADRFPFAYLDFDRPALLASEPATILVEAVRQIGLQYPVAYQAAERLRIQWTELLQAGIPVRSGGSKKTSPGTVRTKQAAGSADTATRQRVLKDFVQFLNTLEVIRGPLLLVLDTFEEVQHRSDVYVRELFKFLEELVFAVPRLRTVLSGRAAVPKIDLQTPIELKDFDDDAAVGFLMQKEQGLTDSVIARAIVKQVGGNPLTLRLAAAVAAEKDEVTRDGIRSLDTHRAFGLIRVKTSNLQGQLFRRILDHIHDDDVEKIAHPGLVLRRVTPDLIWKVLAGPCGVAVPTMERAQDLFGKLQKEVSLVSPAGAGVLEHRADVRRLMLGPLRETRPRETREIDELAASYYAQQPGVTARAEEIYHRLVLGEPHDEIEALFLDGVEGYLGSAIDELAAPEKAFLAERLGVELPEDAWAGATQQVWERTAIRKIDEALAVSNLEAALAVLSERRERTPQTLLYVQELNVLIAAAHFGDAAGIVEKALEAYAAEGNLLGVFEVQLAAAELARRQGDVPAAVTRLASAEAIAQSTENDMQLMRVLVARALAMETTTSDPAPTQQAIVACAARISDETWRDDPVLLRLAGALSMDGQLMGRAIRSAGLSRLRVRQQVALKEYIELGFDDEGLAVLAESHPNRRFVLATFSDILRNDTVAEVGEKEIPRVGELSVAVSDEELHEAVSLLEIDRETLRRILSSVDYSIDSLTFELEPKAALRHVVDSARRNGWLATLIHALRSNARANVDFLRFADRIGVGFAPKELRGESLSRKRLATLLDSRRIELASIETRICRVESGQLTGTGFLIAPDLVLTSGDAAAGYPLSVRFDSGQTEGRIYAMGTSVRVLRVTSLDTADPRPAVLHLERPISFEPVRGDAAGLPRGSFALAQPEGAVVAAEQPVVWIWYEKDLCIGGATRVIHPSPTELGFPIRPRDAFRGAPCFDLDLNLLAVHCGANRRLKLESIARPIGMIAAELLRMQVP
ncbi:MAG: ATP-binding protein [Acidobacteriota bacterium]